MTKNEAFMKGDFDFSDKAITELTDDEVNRFHESFAVEYLNGGKLADALHDMGCSFRQSGIIGDNENEVYAVGVKPDGTEIRIEAKKGKDYKSPKEYVQEVRARLKATEDKQ
jgi:hypothetical protein